MIKRLYEKVTGTPWTTERSLSGDGMVPLGALYAEELATLTDSELLRLTPVEAIEYAGVLRTQRAVERYKSARRRPAATRTG